MLLSLVRAVHCLALPILLALLSLFSGFIYCGRSQ
ncbi:MAG: hypothetical protein HOH60_06740 [Opitutae bacterium]|nr:hypothetical protein [Opitutae bacterium]MBT5916034.1 hypothetical protein [Opitutae bacterium]MBT7406719.1 hypothetical protein [Opitutae bacterium]